MLMRKLTCDVCHAVVQSPRAGRIVAGPLERIAHSIHESLVDDSREPDAEEDEPSKLTPDQRRLIMLAIGRTWSVQAVEEQPDEEGGDVATDPLHDLLESDESRVDRLLAEGRLRFWLMMIVHDDCLPQENYPTLYGIALDRINTAEKAIEWTLHLHEKRWFSAHAWCFILGDLFERTHA